MVNKKKLTKQVYFQGKWWKLEKVISPTREDDYLLLSLVDKSSAHYDGTPPVLMILIDCHNDEFYTDEPIIREILERRDSLMEEAINRGKDDRLSDNWLSACGT